MSNNDFTNGFRIEDCGWTDGLRLMPLDDEDRNSSTVLVKTDDVKHRGFDVFDNVGNFVAHFRTREAAEKAVANPEVLFGFME